MYDILRLSSCGAGPSMQTISKVYDILVRGLSSAGIPKNAKDQCMGKIHDHIMTNSTIEKKH